MFSCLLVYASGFSVLPLLSGTAFSVYLLTSNTEFWEEDVEVGVGVAEELVERPGTTNGT